MAIPCGGQCGRDSLRLDNYRDQTDKATSRAASVFMSTAGFGQKASLHCEIFVRRKRTGWRSRQHLRVQSDLAVDGIRPMKPTEVYAVDVSGLIGVRSARLTWYLTPSPSLQRVEKARVPHTAAHIPAASPCRQPCVERGSIVRSVCRWPPEEDRGRTVEEPWRRADR